CKELLPYGRGTCPNCFINTYLPCPFGYRYQHDVHKAYNGTNQGDDTDNQCRYTYGTYNLKQHLGQVIILFDGEIILHTYRQFPDDTKHDFRLISGYLFLHYIIQHHADDIIIIITVTDTCIVYRNENRIICIHHHIAARRFGNTNYIILIPTNRYGMVYRISPSRFEQLPGNAIPYDTRIGARV